MDETRKEAEPLDEQQEYIQILEAELEKLRAAVKLQEQQILADHAQMDRMLREVEAQRNELRETSDAITRAHTWVDRIVRTMGEALLVIDIEGRIERVNPRLLELTAYREEELIGANPDVLFRPEDLDALAARQRLPFVSDRSRVYQLLSAMERPELDAHLRTRDGRDLPHLVRASVMRSPKGKKEGLVVVGTDVRELRTAMQALELADRDMRLVLDHVVQGLCTIDREGRMSSERSAALDRWFGPPEPGTTLWDYLGAVDPTAADWMRLGMQSILDDILPLELALDQMPKRLDVGGRHFELSYTPIFEAAQLDKLLAVVSDVTARVESERAERDKREALRVFGHVLHDRHGFLEFLREARVLVARIGEEDHLAEQRRRDIHTLKGNCSLFGIDSLVVACHRIETRWAEELREPSLEERRGLAAIWEGLESKVKPLTAEGMSTLAVTQEDYAMVLAGLKSGVAHEELAKLMADWTSEPMELRLSRIAEQARTTARRWGKGDIDVVCEPNGMRLPPERFQQFWSVFAHVVRNAIDHGLETPEERARSGKRERGQLRLRTDVVGDRLVIELSDDGRGIDWKSVASRALALDLPASTHEELQAILFADGLSSRHEATMLSGRGIGLGVVRDVCEGLGGRVEIDSEPDRGTAVRFLFPQA